VRSEQSVNLVIGDDRAPKLSLGSHGWSRALSADRPQQQQVDSSQPFCQFFEDGGHGLGESLVVSGPCAFEFGLLIEHAKHLSAKVVHDFGVGPALRKEGVVAILWGSVLLGAVVVGVGVLASSADCTARLTALEAPLTSACTSGVSGLNSARCSALEYQRLNRTRGNLFGIAKVLPAAATAAVTGLYVIHLVGIQGGIFGIVGIEILAHDDCAIDGKGTGSKGLKGPGRDVAAVDFAAVGHRHAPQLGSVKAIFDAVNGAVFAVLLGHGVPC